ncbi:MAG: hypothetical protein ABFC57_11310 [Veillonellales bacterium]
MMIRRNSRRTMNFFNRPTNETEEHGGKSSVSDQKAQVAESNPAASCNAETMIADIAQGFVQAQAKITEDSLKTADNQEIICLLQKLNSQLEKFQQTATQQAITSNSKSNLQQGAMESSDQPQKQSQKQTKSQENTVAVQTAPQVLAQAQFELANELEASLQKLKQVISESEKIANKISNLLGEENQSSNLGGE